MGSLLKPGFSGGRGGLWNKTPMAARIYVPCIYIRNLVLAALILSMPAPPTRSLRPPSRTLYCLHYLHIFVCLFFNVVSGRNSVFTAEERRQCIAIVYGDLLRNALLVKRASMGYGIVHTFRRSTSPVRLLGVFGEFPDTCVATELMHVLRRKFPLRFPLLCSLLPSLCLPCDFACFVACFRVRVYPASLYSQLFVGMPLRQKNSPEKFLVYLGREAQWALSTSIC